MKGTFNIDAWLTERRVVALSVLALIIVTLGGVNP